MHLYAQLLGEEFHALPVAMRTFHTTLPTSAVGQSRVVRAQRGLTGILAWLMRFPASGRRVPLRLVVVSCKYGERWQRWFADQPLTTTQFARQGKLVERAGLVDLWFALTRERGRMVFRTQRATILGTALPKLLHPHIQATVRGTAQGWVAKVIIRSPWGTILARYRAEVYYPPQPQFP